MEKEKKKIRTGTNRFVIAKRILRQQFEKMGDVLCGSCTFEAKDDALSVTRKYFAKTRIYDSFIDVIIDKSQIILLISPISGFHLPYDNGSSWLWPRP